MIRILKKNSAAETVRPARSAVRKRLMDSRYLILLFLPCLIYYILFRYVPMWGVLIPFKNYHIFKGFFASPWVGLENFSRMFHSVDFTSLLSNTFKLGIMCFLIEFPFPIIFALILNEVRNRRYQKFVQTVSYMPYFISMVVVVGMLNMALNPRNGIINNLIASFGMEKINFLVNATYFRWIYVLSDIWQYMGWGAIIYLAALSGVDVQLYEAATIDGANKWKQIIHITLPCISPVIITMLLLNTGSIVDIGFEKVYLMQNPSISFQTDVFATYVYRIGLQQGNVSYGAAYGVMNSLINLFFILISNWLANRFSETSLW
jgi:putative aldouronate transport system permease protein